MLCFGWDRDIKMPALDPVHVYGKTGRHHKVWWTSHDGVTIQHDARQMKFSKNFTPGYRIQTLEGILEFFFSHVCRRGGEAGGSDQSRDGCPNGRHLFLQNYVKVWTQKCGQKLSMTCGVDFVLFKPLYMKIAFITICVFNFSSYETHNWVLKRPL